MEREGRQRGCRRERAEMRRERGKERERVRDGGRERASERRRATKEERELESPLVWQPRLSLAMRHAGSQGATATVDCGLAKVYSSQDHD